MLKLEIYILKTHQITSKRIDFMCKKYVAYVKLLKLDHNLYCLRKNLEIAHNLSGLCIFVCEPQSLNQSNFLSNQMDTKMRIYFIVVTSLFQTLSNVRLSQIGERVTRLCLCKTYVVLSLKEDGCGPCRKLHLNSLQSMYEV